MLRGKLNVLILLSLKGTLPSQLFLLYPSLAPILAIKEYAGLSRARRI